MSSKQASKETLEEKISRLRIANTVPPWAIGPLHYDNEWMRREEHVQHGVITFALSDVSDKQVSEKVRRDLKQGLPTIEILKLYNEVTRELNPGIEREAQPLESRLSKEDEQLFLTSFDSSLTAEFPKGASYADIVLKSEALNREIARYTKHRQHNHYYVAVLEVLAEKLLEDSLDKMKRSIHDSLGEKLTLEGMVDLYTSASKSLNPHASETGVIDKRVPEERTFSLKFSSELDNQIAYETIYANIVKRVNTVYRMLESKLARNNHGYVLFFSSMLESASRSFIRAFGSNVAYVSSDDPNGIVIGYDEIMRALSNLNVPLDAVEHLRNSIRAELIIWIHATFNTKEIRVHIGDEAAAAAVILGAEDKGRYKMSTHADIHRLYDVFNAVARNEPTEGFKIRDEYYIRVLDLIRADTWFRSLMLTNTPKVAEYIKKTLIAQEMANKELEKNRQTVVTSTLEPPKQPPAQVPPEPQVQLQTSPSSPPPPPHGSPPEDVPMSDPEQQGEYGIKIYDPTPEETAAYDVLKSKIENSELSVSGQSEPIIMGVDGPYMIYYGENTPEFYLSKERNAALKFTCALEPCDLSNKVIQVDSAISPQNRTNQSIISFVLNIRYSDIPFGLKSQIKFEYHTGVFQYVGEAEQSSQYSQHLLQTEEERRTSTPPVITFIDVYPPEHSEDDYHQKVTLYLPERKLIQAREATIKSFAARVYTTNFGISASRLDIIMSSFGKTFDQLSKTLLPISDLETVIETILTTQLKGIKIPRSEEKRIAIREAVSSIVKSTGRSLDMDCIIDAYTWVLGDTFPLPNAIREPSKYIHVITSAAKYIADTVHTVEFPHREALPLVESWAKYLKAAGNKQEMTKPVRNMLAGYLLCVKNMLQHKVLDMMAEGQQAAKPREKEKEDRAPLDAQLDALGSLSLYRDCIVGQALGSTHESYKGTLINVLNVFGPWSTADRNDKLFSLEDILKHLPDDGSKEYKTSSPGMVKPFLDEFYKDLVGMDLRLYAKSVRVGDLSQ